jgi:hypothetical protein
VATSEAEFSAAACASAKDDATLLGEAEYLETPRSYSNCGKGFVVDVADSTGTQATVHWNDALPATAAGCRDISVAAKYYEWSSRAWRLQAEDDAVGVWIQFPGICIPPRVDFGLSAPEFRIAATARRTTGELTRKFLLLIGG